MARLAQCKQSGQVQPGVKMYKDGGVACAGDDKKAKMYKKGGAACAGDDKKAKMYKKGGAACVGGDKQEKMELKQAKALQSKASMGKKSGGLMKGCK